MVVLIMGRRGGPSLQSQIKRSAKDDYIMYITIIYTMLLHILYIILWPTDHTQYIYCGRILYESYAEDTAAQKNLTQVHIYIYIIYNTNI